MNELERVLIGDSAAAPAAHILEGLGEDVVHREMAGVPHTIYQEVWHLAFWQQVTLDWVGGVETPYPVRPEDGFPPEVPGESWDEVRERFLAGAEAAAAWTRDAGALERRVRCPSRPGEPVRVMTVREQMESLAAHNAYHLGRVVLLRQMNGAWPPASGGFSW